MTESKELPESDEPSSGERRVTYHDDLESWLAAIPPHKVESLRLIKLPRVGDSWEIP